MFSVVGRDGQQVGNIDANLASPHVAAGQANIAYTIHPANRGRGYAGRAIALTLRFLRDHTGAREAYLHIDHGNTASLSVARKVGALPTGAFVQESGRTLAQHVVRL